MSNDIEYDLDALKVGIDKCHNNVKVFEDAITREYDTVRRYKKLVADLETKKALAQ